MNDTESGSTIALTQRLREGTRALHRAAERAGAMRALLIGTLDRDHYRLLLRNLHALYTALEDALERDRVARPETSLSLQPLYRSDAIAADLDLLGRPPWRTLPLVRTTAEYVDRLHAIAGSQPDLLAAHAYVRYLGDLSGGQLLRDMVRRAYDLPLPSGTRFYEFDGDVGGLRQQLRRALDAGAIASARHDAIVAEAQAAFALHVRLFEELHPPPSASG